MAQKIIDIVLTPISEYYGSEVSLYYPGLYAGSTDLVCLHNGKETIADFKQANKPKKEDWIEDYFHKHSEVNNFVKWLEVTTEQKVENIWGVLYYDNGGIKWHSHHPNDDVSHSFVYYVNVPNNSSSTRFSKDPSKEGNDVDVPIIEGHCLVWDHNLPHCVPPSNHNGRCVISGNLK